MTSQPIELKAREYVYDLRNLSREFGFKPDETWEVMLVTHEERLVFVRNYYPIASAKALPELLAEMFDLVKAKLSQTIDNKKQWDSNSIAKNHLEYIIAFNPARLRTC
ncbi:hypothetical protein ACPPVU_03330 [Mucilaginibacter sp. McL0603]|uniref:hypothetical protein n=1 Tax=Mucilaginibacter sp. McL0603 TaxID=3415670 RepID=UPI003CF72E07